MKKLISILFLILFVSLHISYPGTSVVSYAAFFVVAIVLTCVTMRCIQGRFIKDFWHGNTLALLYLLFLIADWIIRGNAYGSVYCFFVIVCWLLFIYWGKLFESRYIQRIVLCSIIACAWIEIAVGFGQLYGLMENSSSFFQFGGSLGNPGAYSGYLSVIFPMVLSVYLIYRRHRKNEDLQNVLLACLIFMLVLIVLSRSRGAWLACLIGCVFVIEHYYGVLRSIRKHFSCAQRLALSVLLGVGLLGGAFFLYKFKADSADGRLLVWKVALQASRENILFGDGLCSFEANYSRWQRDYFASGEGTEREKYLADYVTCAYNEFLQVFIDQGTVGMLLFFGVILFALLRKKSHCSHVFIGAKASLLGFLVLCCVSYPLRIPLLYLHLIIVLALLLTQESTSRQHIVKWMNFVMPVCILIATVFFSMMGLWMIYGIRLLEKGLERAAHEDWQGSMAQYQKAYPIMNNNGTFLFCYAMTLTSANRPEKSIEMLKRAESKSSNPSIYNLMGENYKSIGNLMAARDAYQEAVNTVPSHMYSRYKIVGLLMDMEHKDEARELANEILNMKEKVPSVAVREIKDEMRQIVKELSNKNR